MTETTCSYDFSSEHLQALWLQFQQDGGASCPETGAAISLELVSESDAAQPNGAGAVCGLRAQRSVRARQARGLRLGGVIRREWLVTWQRQSAKLGA